MNIGKLISVSYGQLRVKISSDIRGGSINMRGDIYFFGNIGSYLKIPNAIGEMIICEIMSIFDADTQKEKGAFNVESDRELLLKPIGTISEDGKFALGVGIYPSIYSDVSIVTFEDMGIILNTQEDTLASPPDNGNVHRSFTLGISKNLINYPVSVSIESFFNIHSAILGNSGSGKSNTIAHILQEIHKKKEHSAIGSRILLFDANGEYKKAFENLKNEDILVRFYRPNIEEKTEGYSPFYLPHFLMSLDEWSAFLLATDATQRPFWDTVLQESYRFYQIGYSDEEERSKFINYLRYKVCKLISNILRQGDTDTAKITTASGVLSSIAKMVEANPKIKDAVADSDLLKDINDLQKNCGLDFGQNKDKLMEALEGVNEKIVYKDIRGVEGKRIRYNAFFDFNFLKVATELVLLEEDSRGNRQIRGYTATMLRRLDYFLENPDCGFMRDMGKISDIDKYRCQLWGDNVNSEKIQLTIIDASELSPDVLETLTSVTARILFDERKTLKGDERRKKPIHLILDEAHRYIRKDYEYLLKENIFEKIAREGRKYSLYLLLSSQRPSELSETVLSQCANFIIHRVQNEKDMKYIQAILPYFSDDFTNKIKQSTPGEALVFGNCVAMPLHLKINLSNPTPNSENCNIPKEWFVENPSTVD